MPTDRRVRVTYNIDPEVADAMQAEADARTWGVSALVGRALVAYLNVLKDTPVHARPPGTDRLPVPGAVDLDDLATAVLILSRCDPDRHVCQCGHARRHHDLGGCTVCGGARCRKFVFNHAPGISDTDAATVRMLSDRATRWLALERDAITDAELDRQAQQ